MEKMYLNIDDLHKLLYRMLEIVEDAANVTSSRYYLHAGTALGTVRHHSLIPWDDDADVIIPIPDYKKMVDYLSHRDLGIFKLLYKEKKATRMQAKLVLKGQSEDLVCVDLFPMIGVPDDRSLQIKLDKYSARIRKIYAYKKVRLSSSDRLWKKIAKNFFSLPFCVFSDRILYKLFEKNVLYKYDFDKSAYVTNPCGKYGMKNVIPKKWYGNGINGEINGYCFPIPSEIEKYLTHYYKDYMKCPDREYQEKMMSLQKEFIGTRENYKKCIQV